MKKLIIIIITCLFPFCVSAQEGIDLSVSETQISQGEMIRVEISLGGTTLPNRNYEMTIEGIDNFNIRGRSTQNQFQHINGQQTQSTQISLDLIATQIGNFTLGPVVLSYQDDAGDMQMIEDDSSYEIEVGGQRSITSVPTQTSSQNYISETTQQKRTGSLLDTIHLTRFPEHRVLKIGVLILALGVVFFLVIQQFLKSQQQPPNEEILPKQHDYGPDLKKLGKNIGNISRQEWYHDFHTLIRKKMQDLGVQGAEYQTLDELEKSCTIKAKKFLCIIEQSYCYEFCEGEDSQDQQKKFLEEVSKII